MKIFPPRRFLRFAFAGAFSFAIAIFALGQTPPGEFAPGGANWERGRPVQLATSPALSPDGGKLAFAWAGDIWTSRVNGGAARRLTTHPAQEGGPVFSPDGQRIAFTSNRTGQSQVWIMAAAGGVPAQVTFHSEGSRVLDWYPDGKSVLVEGTRDFATRSSSRFFRIDLTERRAESLLFDAEGHSASLSPDGTKLLFCRERDDLYRRGYRGSRSSQIWMAEGLETLEPKFTKLIARESGARSPLWKPDGAGFYYLGDHGKSGLFDVWEHDLKSGEEKQLTRVRNDPALLPTVSRGGGVMVFTQGFEFQRLVLTGEEANGKPRPLRLRAVGDTIPDFMERRSLTKAENLSFSEDGLEVAFAAGGDIWVMDTELREPIAVTRTPDEEREPVFSGDGGTLYFIRDSGSGSEIVAAERTDSGKYWWRNQTFNEKQVSRDGAARGGGDRGSTNKNDLQIVPGDEWISWISGAGDLWVAKRDGSGARRLLESWNKPSYAWSPDGKWIAWAVSDSDFNRDVWISRADGKEPPYNLSRHPNNDTGPAWSPDGKMLAFTGQRQDKEVDIHYVYLSLSEEEKDKRDRTLESALEKMEKLRKKAPSPPPAKPEPVKTEAPKPEPPIVKPKAEPKTEPTKAEPDTSEPAKPEPAKPEAPKTEPTKVEAPKPKLPEVNIDFERLAERVKRVSLAGSTESGLFWSHESKRLAFTRDLRGSKGTYTISFPDKLTPVLLHTKTGSLPRWIARDDTLLWLVEGVPSALSKGVLTAYPFTARQQYDQREYRRVAFLQIWRTMGETWYDEKLNHLDWEKVRGKYENAAAVAPDAASFDRVVGMMLGELNGSHLGFRSDNADSSGWRAPGGWSEVTAHLGLLFDRAHEGPGLKVSRVLARGPVDRTGSRVAVGEIILQIDGHSVDPATDLTLVLNGVLPRDVRLTLAEKPGKSDAETDVETKPREREIVIRPITYTAARGLLEEARTEQTRALVDRLSEGRLGYVPVPKMDWGDFVKFQEELFASGVGREGLILDVRDNGGGFTTDHLLTALMPAEHAITVPRGGGPGYPQDRRVYATWNKPVTVLCNQNSFSNAEIFSHAIKELGRGKLVGVTTAGGVVSTGSTRIRDLGVLRVPFRGWFRKSDGTDMELNGARPDVEVWDHPDDTVAGRDRQIEKAVAVLLEDVAAAKALPRPELKPASGR